MHTVNATLRITFILLSAVAVAAQTQAGVSSDKPSTGSVSAAPEYGESRNWEVTAVSRALNLREEPSNTAHIVAGYLTSRLWEREVKVPIYKKKIIMPTRRRVRNVGPHRMRERG